MTSCVEFKTVDHTISNGGATWRLDFGGYVSEFARLVLPFDLIKIE